MGPNSVADTFISEREGVLDTDTHKRRQFCENGGVVLPQAKEHLGRPEAGQGESLP